MEMGIKIPSITGLSIKYLHEIEIEYIHKVKLNKVIFSVDLDFHDYINKKEDKEPIKNLFLLRLTSLPPCCLKLVLYIANFL